MKYELLYAKAMNKAYIDFTSDSVMKKVALYYDKHGSKNEQMEAYIIAKTKCAFFQNEMCIFCVFSRFPSSFLMGF